MHIKRLFPFVYIIVFLLVFFLFFDYVFPFLVGVLIAVVVQKTAMCLGKATGLPNRMLSTVCLLLFYVLILCIVFFLGKTIYYEINDFFLYLPQFFEHKLSPALKNFESSVLNLSKGSGIEKIIFTLFSNYQGRLGEYVGTLSVNAAEFLAKCVGKIPDMLIGTMAMVVTSFFVCTDYDKICLGVLKFLPCDTVLKFKKIKTLLSNTVLKIIKAYFILFVITLTQLALGLFLLRVEHFIIISLLIAFMDVFPLIGVGSVLVPWAIIEFINNNIHLATGLVVLFLIVSIVRNMAEPKILGKNIGVHPLISLVLMYVGLKMGSVIFAVLLLMFVVVLKQYFQYKY